MIFYFFIFIVAYLFARLSMLSLGKKAKKWFIFWSFLAILLPAIVAGARSMTVGTDTSIYPRVVFGEIFNVENISSLFSILGRTSEPIFLAIIYIAKSIIRSYGFVYFVIQFLNLVCVYYVCFAMGGGKKYPLAYLAYLILFFNPSLNMIRQSLAIGVALVGLVFAVRRKLPLFILTIAIASLIHNSALVFVLVYPMLYVINGKMRTVAKLALISCAVLFIVFFRDLVGVVVSIAPAFGKYVAYLSEGRGSISAITAAIKIICVLGVWVLSKKITAEKKEMGAIIFLYSLGNILYFLAAYGDYIQRISLYFVYPVFLFIPFISSIFIKKQQKIIATILIFGAMSYSYLYYGYLNYHETVPYRGDFRNLIISAYNVPCYGDGRGLMS